MHRVNIVRKLAISLVESFGICLHRGEMFDREDGKPVLRCRRCHRTRDNPLWVSGEPKFKRQLKSREAADDERMQEMDRAWRKARHLAIERTKRRSR